MLRYLPLSRVAIYGGLILAAAIYLFPMAVMLSTGLKTMPEIQIGNALSLPRDPTFAAFAKAWSGACTGINCEGIQRYFLNTVILIIPTALIPTFLGMLNGYVLSQWRFRGSEVFFALLLFGCFIPLQVVLLPMAQVLGWLGLANSYGGLMLVHIAYGIPFTTMFFRNYYVSLPPELVRAARVDGASFFQIFWSIIVPISGPIIIVSLIWQFTQVWNDFLFAVIFSGADSQPVMVALNNIVKTSTGTKEYNVDMAAALLAGLPTLIVYLISGRFFVRGLTAGAVKG